MNGLIDLRCPVSPIHLFAKINAPQTRILPDNVIEVACPRCRKALRHAGGDVKFVLHRFNLLGEHIESETVWAT